MRKNSRPNMNTSSNTNPITPDSATQSRVWFITGASRGLGVEIAEAALARGERVIATARNPADVTQRFGKKDNLLALQLDVTNEAQARSAVGIAHQHFGRIDIVVNNAGYGLVGAIEEISDQEAKAVFETNVFGLLNVTRAVLPYLRGQKSGHVINMSSLAGYKASAGFGIYGATKFAVEAISEALSAELAPVGICVLLLEPGYFRTDFADHSSLRGSGRSFDDYASTVGKTRELVRQVNHKQPNDPSKLARALLTAIEAENPPFRLPLGKDAIARVRDKNAFVDKELSDWLELAQSTAFAEETGR